MGGAKNEDYHKIYGCGEMILVDCMRGHKSAGSPGSRRELGLGRAAPGLLGRHLHTHAGGPGHL